jgi:hypothetical protein
MSARSHFGRLSASSLFCKRCNQAMPVKERLLLVLPDKELYEYLCTGCGDAVGTRQVSAAEQVMRREAAQTSSPQVRIL